MRPVLPIPQTVLTWTIFIEVLPLRLGRNKTTCVMITQKAVIMNYNIILGGNENENVVLNDMGF